MKNEWLVVSHCRSRSNNKF